MKPSLKGFSTEEIAERILSEQEFEILERRKILIKDTVPIAEIDILAKKNNELYAIEVKSGKISVTDIRQTYTNAMLINAKPLIVGKGFSDKASELTAKLLNVEVLTLDEYFSFISLEELTASIDSTFINILSNLFSFDLSHIKPEDIKIIYALATSNSFSDAAKTLSIDKKDLGKIISGLKKRKIITYTHSFNTIRLQANIIYNLMYLQSIQKIP